MSMGPHEHYFHKILDAKITLYVGGQYSGQEEIVIYKQCDCGDINREKKFVTHENFREIK